MKKKVFIVIWIIATAGIFYFWSLRNVEDKAVAESEEIEEVVQEESDDEPALTMDSEKLPVKLKSRIDAVLSQIEDMWDPNGTKVVEIGERMDALEVALEQNNAELAEKILSEMEVIISEK
ncbi:MAG: hypothetical protein ACJAT2_001114 [Bacteriovoracaceae bacterium]|jgi:hypothetical protein